MKFQSAAAGAADWKSTASSSFVLEQLFFLQRHLRYLKEYRRATYITLFTSGRLNNYLADIDRQAQERMERLTEQMKRVQGITEQLKAENALEWTQRMNNIRACAKEIVEKEIIFA